MERRSGIKIMAGLIGLVKPLVLYMFSAIAMGTAGFIAAAAVPVLGAVCVLNLMGFNTPFSPGTYFILLIFAAVIRGILRYGEQACNHYIAFRLLAIIRDMVFSALRKLCPAKLEGRDKGGLISLITSDIELLEVFYAHTISPVAIGIICSVIFTAFTASIHPLLGIISAAAYITVGAIMPVINGKRVKKAGMEYRNISAELNSLFLESLRGMRELMQYDRTENAAEKIDKKTGELAAAQDVLKKSEAINSASSDSAIYIFDLIMLFASAALYYSGKISFNSVFNSLITLMSTYGPVIALSNLSNNLAQTLASGERVLSLLEEKPETEEIIDGISSPLCDIQCDKVTFGYGNEIILNNVSLSAPKGKITGIYGKSGCGKSTLLKLIMRFWDKDSGRILLSGNDVKEINTHCLRQNESYCTQETHLFNDTIGNNIRIAKQDATDEEVAEAAKAASIHDFIVSLPDGYDTPIGELGGRLSGGQKQRIGIARAFLSPAPIMLLDEPTSNLDSLNEGIILKSLHNAHDKTIVLVSHRKSTLGITDNIYSIKSGRTS